LLLPKRLAPSPTNPVSRSRPPASPSATLLRSAPAARPLAPGRRSAGRLTSLSRPADPRRPDRQDSHKKCYNVVS